MSKRLLLLAAAALMSLTGTPAASAMKVKPADLTSHAVHSLTEGEIYWVIANGIKTSGMPGLATKYIDRERWEITLYARQLPEAPRR